MIDIPELKPCPFCGGTDIWPTPHRNPFGLVCGGCGSEGPPESYVDPDEAITAWNTRTPPQIKPLVWVETRHKSPDQLGIRSGAIGINYVIISSLMRDNSILSSGGSANIGPFYFDTIEAAKAAAQADYTRRILDALA